MIKLINLTKKFGDFRAVDNLNLKIKRGRVFALVGPNGAGKTTTLLMLSGILKPTSGEIYISDKRLNNEVKAMMGVVPEQPYVYGNLTAYEFLSFFAELQNTKEKDKRIDYLLGYLNLQVWKDKKLKNFSKGMKQKISIGRALIHDPEILILDEPIHGLDPIATKEIRERILDEREKGKTIIISSHILSEVEKVCDDVGIMDRGVLVESGSLDKIRNKVFGTELVIELKKINENVVREIKNFDFINDVSVEQNNLMIRMKAGKDYREKIFNILVKNNCIILEMRENKRNLEEIFLNKIKKK